MSAQPPWEILVNWGEVWEVIDERPTRREARHAAYLLDATKLEDYVRYKIRRKREE